MAAGHTTTKSSTIVPILHLVFTIVSIAVLSYKVYHVESELSFLRDELSTRDRSDGLTKSTAAPISEHSRSERRSDRNRRRDHKDAYGNGDSHTVIGMRGSPGPPGKQGPPGKMGPPGPPGKCTSVNVTAFEKLAKRFEAYTQREIAKFASPRFTSKIPPTVTIREGTKLLINISASGNPAPKITWYLQGAKHHNQSRFKYTDEFFEIMEARFEDQGMITCQAENVFGTRVARVKLIVFGPPRFTITPPGQVIGFLKKKTMSQCGVVGYPTPEVKWNRSPPSPLPKGRSTVINGNLHIDNTEDSDGGVYICIATNKHGMIIHGTFLKVESVVLPVFSSTPSSSVSVPRIREALRVNCSARGSPRPTVTWYKNDVRAPVTNKVTDNEFTSELVIGEFQSADQATYKCVARNVYNDTVETSTRIFLPNCGHPGNAENAVLVHSTYWAGDWVRYLCNPGYTMLGPAVRRCLPSGQWSGNSMQCKTLIEVQASVLNKMVKIGTDKPECVHHMVLDDDSRRVGCEWTGQHDCDSDLAEGWYRFINGKRMNEQCAKYHVCNTDNPGWLVGRHPSVSAGRVTRKVCFGQKSSSSCPCFFHTYIKVRNCGSFYVYKLKPTPKCYLRYCTN